MASVQEYTSLTTTRPVLLNTGYTIKSETCYVYLTLSNVRVERHASLLNQYMGQCITNISNFSGPARDAYFWMCKVKISGIPDIQNHVDILQHHVYPSAGMYVYAK